MGNNKPFITKDNTSAYLDLKDADNQEYTISTKCFGNRGHVQPNMLVLNGKQ